MPRRTTLVIAAAAAVLLGLWAGRPYLILSLGSDSLAAWTIEEGRIEPLSVTFEAPGNEETA